jgi:hypothetical protein
MQNIIVGPVPQKEVFAFKLFILLLLLLFLYTLLLLLLIIILFYLSYGR